MIHVFWGDVKDDGLIVDRVEGVLLDSCFLLFQSPPVTQQGYFDIGICANEGSARHGVLNRLLLFLFDTGSTLQPRLTSNSQPSTCLSFPSAEVTGVSHH